MPNPDRTDRAVVMGLGRFGGGSGVARYLLEEGFEVLVTDIQSPEALEAEIERLRSIEKACEYWGLDFKGSECISHW